MIDVHPEPRELTMRDFLPAVMKGVGEELAVGFMPLKFNAADLRSINYDGLCDLDWFAHERKS